MASPLRIALKGIDAFPKNNQGKPEPLSQFLREYVVPYSSGRAGEVASRVYDTFPAFHPEKGELAEEVVGRPDWVARVHEDAKMDALKTGSREIFKRMGEVIRRIYADTMTP